MGESSVLDTISGKESIKIEHIIKVDSTLIIIVSIIAFMWLALKITKK